MNPTHNFYRHLSSNSPHFGMKEDSDTSSVVSMGSSVFSKKFDAFDNLTSSDDEKSSGRPFGSIFELVKKITTKANIKKRHIFHPNYQVRFPSNPAWQDDIEALRNDENWPAFKNQMKGLSKSVNKVISSFLKKTSGLDEKEVVQDTDKTSLEKIQQFKNQAEELTASEKYVESQAVLDNRMKPLITSNDFEGQTDYHLLSAKNINSSQADFKKNVDRKIECLRKAHLTSEKMGFSNKLKQACEELIDAYCEKADVDVKTGMYEGARQTIRGAWLCYQKDPNFSNQKSKLGEKWAEINSLEGNSLVGKCKELAQTGKLSDIQKDLEKAEKLFKHIVSGESGLDQLASNGQRMAANKMLAGIENIRKNTKPALSYSQIAATKPPNDSFREYITRAENAIQKMNYPQAQSSLTEAKRFANDNPWFQVELHLLKYEIALDPISCLKDAYQAVPEETTKAKNKNTDAVKLMDRLVNKVSALYPLEIQSLSRAEAEPFVNTIRELKQKGYPLDSACQRIANHYFDRIDTLKREAGHNLEKINEISAYLAELKKSHSDLNSNQQRKVVMEIAGNNIRYGRYYMTEKPLKDMTEADWQKAKRYFELVGTGQASQSQQGMATAELAKIQIELDNFKRRSGWKS